jgi:hypothetical protein
VFYSLPWCFLYAGVESDLGSVAADAFGESNVLSQAIGFRFKSHGDYIVVELSLWCFWYFFED